MANSHGSYEDRIGKFIAANTLIQAWVDYDPSNPLITQGGYTNFIAAVEATNTAVTTTNNAGGVAKDDRRPLCFTIYDENAGIGIINPNCAEERLVRVHSYLKGLLPEDSATVDAVNTVLKKIRPNYRGATSKKSFTLKAGQEIAISNVVDNEPAKNTGNTDLSWQAIGGSSPPVSFGPGQETLIIAPGGNILVKNLSNITQGKVRLVVKSDKSISKSPMEKTVASIPGFLNEVITLCGSLPPGVDYDPPDALLSIAELEGLHDDIVAANAAVTTTMDAYGTANRDRKKLYDGGEGMAKRITLTKSYLASFSGGKKSEHFIEYTQAIKGT